MKGLLQRLDEGLVIGDGGFVWQLEKRGYVTGGAYTPEVVLERPETGKKQPYYISLFGELKYI